jgi:hypothetical protein
VAEFTATIKAGPGYADPWIVVKAESADLLSAALEELHNGFLEQRVARIADSFQSAYKAQTNPDAWRADGSRSR